MEVIFKGGVVDKFKIVTSDGKKLFDVAKRNIMGFRYTIMKNSVKLATVEKNAYNISQASIIIGSENIGIIEKDWTNKLTIKLKNKWYISTNKDGYYIRSYGKIVAKVNCKYGLSDKYVCDIALEDDALVVVAFILALDIINYEVER